MIGQTFRQNVDHRRVAPQRAAEIAAQRRAGPAEVLDVERVVQAERGLDAGAVPDRRDVVLRHHQIDHVARDQADGDEDDDAGEEEGGDEEEEAAEEVGPHRQWSNLTRWASCLQVCLHVDVDDAAVLSSVLEAQCA